MINDPAETDTDSRTNILHWYDPSSAPMTITDGNGTRVVDDEGTEYLDFISQLYCVNAGHGNQAIVDAMIEQLERVQYVSSAKQTPVRTELSEGLAAVAPESLSNVQFSVTGSEANELAMTIARDYADAPKVLSRWRSYHGSTYGAGSMTGDPETRGKIEAHASTTGAVKFLPPMTHGSPFNADTPEELATTAADHLEFVIRNEGPDTIAAILTEPIAGSSGAYSAPPGYFERVRELCDEYGILLIVDEVITGFGCCGDWFGVQTEGVEPDLLTFAKGVTSAYAPLAGVMMRPEIAEHVRSNGFDLGQTFGGHPVGCVAGVAALEAYDDGLIENVRALSDGVADRLEALEREHDVVADVRGRGFLRAVEFADPATGKPFHDTRVDKGDNPVRDVIDETNARGVLVGAGRPATQIILSPPLCTTADEIDAAVSALDAAIDEVF